MRKPWYRHFGEPDDYSHQEKAGLSVYEWISVAVIAAVAIVLLRGCC